ncbi:VOC family protein [Paenibacillus sp. F411]|uniref:VOC family protein n=1 Tax=Paenibacillus sp. F411 TaxID=2820239 RepID=UPI001AAFBC01|nr:VOC family protein [Paenibacillus sp. F411]MBO2944283.1 VOC family protein [Paenibacillus sp. F411]
MIPERVSLITIGAKQLPQLRQFYQRLGWREMEFSSDSYCVFRTAGVLLSLFPLTELLKDAGLSQDYSIEGFKGITLAINVDQPGEVDTYMEEVRAAGGTVIREASDAFWGGRTAYFLDPESNAWEIAWNPDSVFDEKGAMISF